MKIYFLFMILALAFCSYADDHMRGGHGGTYRGNRGRGRERMGRKPPGAPYRAMRMRQRFGQHNRRGGYGGIPQYAEAAYQFPMFGTEESYTREWQNDGPPRFRGKFPRFGSYRPEESLPEKESEEVGDKGSEFRPFFQSSIENQTESQPNFHGSILRRIWQSSKSEVLKMIQEGRKFLNRHNEMMNNGMMHHARFGNGPPPFRRRFGNGIMAVKQTVMLSCLNQCSNASKCETFIECGSNLCSNNDRGSFAFMKCAMDKCKDKECAKCGMACVEESRTCIQQKCSSECGISNREKKDEYDEYDNEDGYDNEDQYSEDDDDEYDDESEPKSNNDESKRSSSDDKSEPSSSDDESERSSSDDESEPSSNDDESEQSSNDDESEPSSNDDESDDESKRSSNDDESEPSFNDDDSSERLSEDSDRDNEEDEEYGSNFRFWNFRNGDKVGKKGVKYNRNRYLKSRYRGNFRRRYRRSPTELSSPECVECRITVCGIQEKETTEQEKEQEKQIEVEEMTPSTEAPSEETEQKQIEVEEMTPSTEAPSEETEEQQIEVEEVTHNFKPPSQSINETEIPFEDIPLRLVVDLQ